MKEPMRNGIHTHTDARSQAFRYVLNIDRNEKRRRKNRMEKICMMTTTTSPCRKRCDCCHFADVIFGHRHPCRHRHRRCHQLHTYIAFVERQIFDTTSCDIHIAHISTYQFLRHELWSTASITLAVT